MSNKKNTHYWLVMALAFVSTINALAITGAISYMAAAILLILNCVAIGTLIVVMAHRKSVSEAGRESDKVQKRTP